MAKKKNKKVIRYRRPLNINVGMIIFFIIFIYLVYINKGYTIFKQIDILDSNSEYYTVRKNMKYGLSVYDHIVLDASMVEEGQLLYQ